MAPTRDGEIGGSQDKQRPAGIGGWLLLVVAGMMVLGPLSGVGRISDDFMAAERQYPALTSLDAWATFKAATWWTFAGFSAVSVYGGWGLVSGRNWSVVRRAIAILWITGPVAALVMAVLIPIIVIGRSNIVDAALAGAFMASVAVASIWTAYFLISIRVRNTYHN